MNIYLPIAELSMNGFLLIALGLVSGFISGMFGVGGGFVMTPLLVFAGIPPIIAVGTQSCQMVGTTISGALTHYRKRMIDIRMGLVVITGSFIGTFGGVILFNWLKRVGMIDLTINFGYMVLLTSVGGIMIFESWRAINRTRPLRAAKAPKRPKRLPLGANWPFQVNFPVSNLRTSFFSPMLIGLLCGVMVAIFGVGGGFILVPAMLYLLRMPVNLVNGTALFKVVFTTGFTAILQAAITHNVDVVLAFFLLLGSVVGAQFGTKYAQKLKPEMARFLLAVLILAVAGKLFYDLAATPPSLYTHEMRYP